MIYKTPFLVSDETVKLLNKRKSWVEIKVFWVNLSCQDCGSVEGAAKQ